MKLTLDQLKKIAPFAKNDRLKTYLPYLNSTCAECQIDTRPRMAAFLAQIIHESGSFVYTREIADGKAYEGREDLGNIHPGDGVKYRGRGLIQVTGRDNYAKCGKALGLDLIAQPEFLEQPENAVKSATWFWVKHDCNNVADTGDMKKLTRIINGGSNGLDERLAIYERAKKVLGA